MQKVRSKDSLAHRNWKKFRRNKLAVAGLVVVAALVLVSIFAFLITHYDPEGVDLKNRSVPPNFQHLLGTDKLGRDMFTRILYGGQISIFVGLSGAVGGAVIGSLLGCVSGYFGGMIDKALLRVSEIFMTFPQMILVLILVTFMGQGLTNLLVIFWTTGWMATYRLVRGRVFSLREENYVLACRAFGIGGGSIMFRHILPNAIGPVIVNATLATAGYVLQESALSFLGLGVPNSIPTWGNIFNAAKSIEIVQSFPWLWIPPGVAICLFVLGVNIFGDGLRDVLDPNQ